MKETAAAHPKDSTMVEGLRARKRRQTRERIVNVALQLFLERGFDAVTVDEIAASADVSKRSFFDYFPTKEEVIFFWQDSFGEVLAVAVAARPAHEPMTQTVEEAFTSSIEAASHPAAIAVDELIRKTPSLRERDYLKYAKLEQTLAGALMRRTKSDRERFRARLLATIVVGGLRLGNEQWQKSGNTNLSNVRAFTKKMFHQIWKELADLGNTAAKSERG
jgi:AcrR family transcriptional regulator